MTWDKLKTLKQKKFVDRLLETLNPTDAAHKVYDVAKRETATQIAHENLRKPYIREEIERRLEEKGLKFEEIVTFWKYNLKQRKHLPTSQEAVKDYLKVTGLLKHNELSTATRNTNVQFIIEK